MFSKTLSLDITRPYNLLIPENRKSERLRQPPKHNIYSRAQITRTLKGNEKVNGVNFGEILMKGK